MTTTGGPGKPICDYDDPDAREQLVDALAKDAHALLGALDGREPGEAVMGAARVLAGGCPTFCV